MLTTSPQPSLLASEVAAATRTARRVVLAGFAATALLVSVLAAERLAFHTTSINAATQAQKAQSLADTILLEDERLTMTALMAATSGQARWTERYEAHLPAIDAAIAKATAMAPPGAAERFDQATRVANDKLVALERQALSLAAEGNLASAQALLLSPGYDHNKAVLAAGSDAFMAEVRNTADAGVSKLMNQSLALLAGFLALACVAFSMLWRLLVRDLGQAEVAFARKQDEVQRMALHDTLTGLPNRRYLHMQLQAAVARAEREPFRMALLMIDLDGFKPVNDRHGHAAGDAVLMAISQRLDSHVRKGELVARLGGDEFVVVLNQGASSEEPARAAVRLIAALSEPIEVAQGEVRVSASVGVALFPADGKEPDDLLRKADVALYRAKNEARGEVRFFSESMDQDVRTRDALELDLRNALANGHIEPYFQPLVDLRSGELTGFEVLARWPHPTRGIVPPETFIALAEDSGQIDALTLSVMRCALKHALHWAPHLSVAINIAPQQLKSASLIDRLLQVLQETGFPPQRFEIEITENALIADLPLARQIVLALKAQGVRVALDDFGTGYSSLSHLSELPFDKIKIDRSFIRTMHQRSASATIVNAIIGLGHSLKLPTTAEGIETMADAQMLTRLGCETGQGFLYARPMPAGAVADFIAQQGGALAPGAVPALHGPIDPQLAW